MTLFKPQLYLRKLVVFHRGNAVYNEDFHLGVNIIRGENSSGKSTIADFIFYVLGGDFNGWKFEAGKCDFVTAEFDMNNTNVTLRRNIDSRKRRPMLVFWGDYESSRNSSPEDWQLFPFQRSNNKENFSQTLFRILEFPDVKGDASSNITMHQVLRLLYIDQLSSVDSFFREEDFDSPLTRETIGNLLIGAYDDSLYNLEIEIREKSKEYDKVNANYKTALDILEKTERQITLDDIQARLEELRIQKSELEKNINTLYDNPTITSEDLNKFNSLKNELVEAKSKYSELVNKIEHYEYEINDTENFLESLYNRLNSLDESMSIYNIFGDMEVTHCPKCLSSISEQNQKNICNLCKNEIPDKYEETFISRTKQELHFQIKESEENLESKKDSLNSFKQQLPSLYEKLLNIQSDYNQFLKNARYTRDEQIDELQIKKGEIEQEIKDLHRQAKAIKVIDDLRQKRSDLAKELDDLKSLVYRKRKKSENRLERAKNKISELTIKLLKRDLDREEKFQIAKNVEIDFRKDTYSLDGRNQFSASSMTYLKNSIRYSIFFASLELEYFRYPRFIICDNMEDKGMEEKRSQNFQNLIVELSESHDAKHQIIFTTSMIDPELDSSSYCVGDHYTENNKSLSI